MTAIAFTLFSIMLLGSGLMVITARNPVYSVLFLIYAFFNAAGLFVILGAEFLAMLLVIVYVGAVAVLFLFVVMMMDINWRNLHRSFSINSKDFIRSALQICGYGLSFLLFFFICEMGFLNLLGYLVNEIPPQTVLESLTVLFTQPQEFFSLPIWSLIGTLYEDNLVSLPSALVGASLILSLWLAKIGAEWVVRSPFRLMIQLFIKNFPAAWFLAGVLGIQIVVMGVLWHDSSVTKILSRSSPFISDPNVPNTQALGQLIYTDYIYVFHLSGMILLLAMIGAIVLTLRRREDVKRQSIGNQVNRRKEDTLHLHDVPLGKGL